jgi:TIR domain
VTAAPSHRWDFFVAHAGPDALIAARITAVLEAGGATVFLDVHELLPGDVWPRVLAQAQHNSAVTVILVSKHTAAAYYQLEELAEAIQMSRHGDAGHRVAPVYLESIERVPYGLRVVHGLWALGGWCLSRV